MKGTLVVMILLVSGCVTSQQEIIETTNSNTKNGLLLASDFDPNTSIEEPENTGKDYASSSNDTIAPKESNKNVTWNYLWLKANVKGIHYNINQEAKEVDSSADNWTLIFGPEAPFRKEDIIYFCGETDSFTVTIADIRDWTQIYQGTIEGVKPC